MSAKRGTAQHLTKPPLRIGQILKWADAHHRQTGRWPSLVSGPIAGTDTTWTGVHQALLVGWRGLPGGDSLARLLARARHVRRRRWRPRLSQKQILAWADAHHARTGAWPTKEAGPVRGAPQENWSAINLALQRGFRGLPGGTSLVRLLANYRGRRLNARGADLSVRRILDWADAHRRITGYWPRIKSEWVLAEPHETWARIEYALRVGSRGLPGGITLVQLLEQRRGYRNVMRLPRLTVKQILAWADAHQKRTGVRPHVYSGPITGTQGETWVGVNRALERGFRGWPGGSSLARLLTKYRGPRRPPLNVKQILTWADDHYAQTGRWPTLLSGPVRAAAGESWAGIQQSLRVGRRGLPGGDSLARVLARYGRKPYQRRSR